MEKKIWDIVKLNKSLNLKNRIVMAPLTRCFADDDSIPSPLAQNYYRQRADCGLIISEATIISPSAQGYPNTPGIYHPRQIAAWKKITDSVHQVDGKIFLQIWHTGRASHSIYLGGQAPVAPSAIALKGKVPKAKDLHYETPRALTTQEVKEVIQDYKRAAINGLKAGLDGIEIHGANGYLIDQFLHRHTNKRIDEYGGSIENRARFALEIIDHIIAEIGHERLGIRLSPGAYFNMQHVDGDEKTFKYLLQEIEKRKLAYVHVGIFDDAMVFDYLGGRASEFLRRHYKGTLIGSGAYTLAQAEKEIAQEKIDLIAFGRPFIANPDLVSRFKTGKELIPYDNSMLKKL